MIASSPANYVTLSRAILAALVASALFQPTSDRLLWTVVVLSTAIGLLDGVDGWVARRTGTSSSFGARFDMETDAAFILVLSLLVWQHDKAGAWVLVCGLMRYAFVAAGWVLPWIRRPLRPTMRGKTVAVLQLIGLTTALGPIIPVPLSTAIAAATLAALAWSFAIDLRRLWAARRMPAAAPA
jgi:phosphatidylglycerophosphate synthase